MMRIILLLLVTLAGPFCTFTQATTLMVPTVISKTSGLNLDSDLPATTKAAAPQDATLTEAPAPQGTEAATSTKEVPVVSTAAPVTQSEAAVETTALTEITQSTKAGPEKVATPEATTGVMKTRAAEEYESKTPGVKMEDEGMSAGQLVGIVIGALIAVIVVIAIIILVVRRMGQYSP